MATSEGIPSSIDIEFLELNDNPYVDITEEEFNKRISNYQDTLTRQFEESHRLETEILSHLKQLQFNQ